MTSTPKIVRLWWRCEVCNWRVDTFGQSHTNEADVQAMGFEVVDHLERKHGMTIERTSDAAAQFRPDGATTRVVNHHVIVKEDKR